MASWETGKSALSELTELLGDLDKAIRLTCDHPHPFKRNDNTARLVYILLRRSSTLVNRLVEHSLWMLGLGMALLVVVQVFYRYVLNGSLFWSEELARYMLVWLSFLGATVAYFRGTHPGLDILVRRFPPQVLRFSQSFVHMLIAGLAVVMVVAGIQFAWFIRMQISPALGIPKWLILAVIPISGALLFLHACTGLATTWQRERDEL